MFADSAGYARRLCKSLLGTLTDCIFVMS